MSIVKNYNLNFFKDKVLLITGGTGSFGRALVQFFLNKKIPLKKIIIFSRDELKQFEMNKIYNENQYSNIRYFIGDVRDKDRLKLALNGVDIVIHAAALKQVPIAEYNPFEFIKTNVLGAQNLIESCLGSSVRNVIALSTDKASSPINLYGATKLCSDKLFTAANNIKGKQDIKFSIVRYGNVMGSRGSVLETFLQQKKSGVFQITNKKMTRFNINMDEAINVVIYSLMNLKGGEVFVPKLASFYITDLAKAVSDSCKINIIGIRPGEKIHEEMISAHDSSGVYDLGKYYLIIPNYLKNKYSSRKIVKKGFSYNSDNNPVFLSINQLKKIIITYQKEQLDK
jgi:UDP-N-acetylglucosamine 4,6-dehydratase (inverting)